MSNTPRWSVKLPTNHAWTSNVPINVGESLTWSNVSASTTATLLALNNSTENIEVGFTSWDPTIVVYVKFWTAWVVASATNYDEFIYAGSPVQLSTPSNVTHVSFITSSGAVTLNTVQR